MTTSPRRRVLCRAALLALPASSLPASLPAQDTMPASSISELVQRAADKNAAFMRGEMQRWHALAHIAADFTLMQPFGGPASHGFDGRPERLAQMAQRFRGGRTSLEVVQVCASETLVVLVMVERQRGEVGGLPDQDWSLRVTEVYRRCGDTWELLHRHADPLLHPMSLERTAALARGEAAAAEPAR